MGIYDRLSMKWQNIISIAFLTLLSTLAIIGWAYFLHFPWAWLFHIILIIELFMLFAVNYSEYQASSVNGAGGWSTFGYIFFQGAFVITITVLRFIIWIAERFGLV